MPDDLSTGHRDAVPPDARFVALTMPPSGKGGAFSTGPARYVREPRHNGWDHGLKVADDGTGWWGTAVACCCGSWLTSAG